MEKTQPHSVRFGREQSIKNAVHVESLTPREREVMAFVTTGLMNKQIAAEIGSAEVTVKLHRGNLMRKMNARSVAELARMAQILGIARPKS
jgi:FixJ family two-component response regulator